MRPFDGTPAKRAGLKEGDVIVAIDGVSKPKWDLDEVVKKIRGPEGTTVKLKIERKGAKPRDVTIERAKIVVPNVMKKMHPGGIGYIRLMSFNEQSETQMREAIDSLKAKGAKGYVIDLRENPGGLLSQAVAVSSLFVEDGVIVRIAQRSGPQEVQRATGNIATKAPVVLLVDSHSASASEIVAAALQDHKRATLVGTKTFGKGSVQTIRDLANGGAHQVHDRALSLAERPGDQQEGRDPGRRREDGHQAPGQGVDRHPAAAGFRGVAQQAVASGWRLTGPSGEAHVAEATDAVTLREITRETVDEVLRLEVAPEQIGRFVASNAKSIAQAHYYPENAWFRAIYAGETPVGFVMLWDDPVKHEYGLWRLMVDGRYQGRGYGRKALELVIDHVRTRPGATALDAGAHPGEGSPISFYEKLGFALTGEVDEDDGELKMRLDL